MGEREGIAATGRDADGRHPCPRPADPAVARGLAHPPLIQETGPARPRGLPAARRAACAQNAY